jgi:hypothetical protein
LYTRLGSDVEEGDEVTRRSQGDPRFLDLLVAVALLTASVYLIVQVLT